MINEGQKSKIQKLQRQNEVLVRLLSKNRLMNKYESGQIKQGKVQGQKLTLVKIKQQYENNV